MTSPIAKLRSWTRNHARVDASLPADTAPTVVSAQDPEMKLPEMKSLILMIVANLLMQISFFILIPTTNEYTQYLGGTSVFSGIVIGVPTAAGGLILLPIVRFDKGKYAMAMHISCAANVLGHIIYALAYKANYLYLILIGRIVSGFGMIGFMYVKRYCTDPNLVGIRRRTTLASWLAITQGLGMSAGPFLGGLGYNAGFKNDIFNGFTSSIWVMALVWVVFWIFFTRLFQDYSPPQEEDAIHLTTVETPASSGTPVASRDNLAPPTSTTMISVMSAGQWGSLATMCWFAMTCFFVLGAYEANIPVFGAEAASLQFSPFAAGNFIALGGICAFPFLFANLFLASRTQDRNILAFGATLGVTGLAILLGILRSDKVSYGTLFVSWWLVALGFNLVTTVTYSLLSKQLPGRWNGRISLLIQYSNYTGRVTGAVWGGAGVKVGMTDYVALEMAFVGIGIILFVVLWRNLKAQRG